MNKERKSRSNIAAAYLCLAIEVIEGEMKDKSELGLKEYEVMNLEALVIHLENGIYTLREL